VTGGPSPEHGTAVLDLAGLTAWGRRVGESLEAPTLVTLEGDLGAGKTTLVKAVCDGLGVDEPVTSPTFALVHQYRGARGMVFHLDLYRIMAPQDLTNLAWDEILGANAVVLVEWPDRAGPALPAPDVAVRLAHVVDDPGVRRVAW
jgi:tRNA threonylcarbamoyladenosine biosynthesis protein TsaE